MIDARWLRSLGPEKLTLLLQRRPDSLASPAPASLAELAERITAPWSVVETLRSFDKPTLQTAEALAALSGCASREDLSKLLGEPDPGALDKAISTLAEHALIVTTGAQVALISAAANAWPSPLQLGVPITPTLERRTVAELKAIGSALGITTSTRKADVLHEVIAALTDHHLIRGLVAKAPRRVRDELLHSARTGEPIELTSFGYYYGYPGRQRSHEQEATDRWGIERGLLVRTDTADGLILVAEVALALRGPHYAAPFDPIPPTVALVAANQQAIDSGGVAAIAAFGNIVTALLDIAGRTPIAILKAGGVGTRELKRLAKAAGTGEPEIRLALTLTYRQNLWQPTSGGCGEPTSHYDEWLAAAPAQRLAELMRTMWTLPQIPLAEQGAWHPIDAGQQVSALRRRLVAELPASAAVADPAVLASLMAWRFPYGVGDPEVAEQFIRAAWLEAELTGIVAGGALTRAGKALLAGGDDGLEDALAAVGEAQTTARFQADLTAVVTGSPSAGLAQLLDAAADRESRGSAAIWRFSPSSVRRALDAGHTATALLRQLSNVAIGGLPQPLEYLIQDAARRHGAIRARAVACCLISDDATLLDSLVAERSLRGLGLRKLAPTVLASAKPLDETLAALRAAGHAPVAEDADGVIQMQQTQARRADPVKRPAARSPKVPAQAYPAEVANRLLAAPDTGRRPPTQTLKTIQAYARQLQSAEQRLLAHAIDSGGSVVIAYVNQAGNQTVREIDEIELVDASLYAWCSERQDSRVFNLGRILAVLPQ